MLLGQLSTENNIGKCRRRGSGHQPEIDSQQPLTTGRFIKTGRKDGFQGSAPLAGACCASVSPYPAAGVQLSLMRRCEPWMVPLSHPGPAMPLQKILKGFASMMEVRDEAGDGSGGNVSGRDQPAGQRGAPRAWQRRSPSGEIRPPAVPSRTEPECLMSGALAVSQRAQARAIWP